MIPMLFLTLLCPIFYLLGIFIRDGHLEPESTWVPIGSFLVGLSYALFFVFLIVAAVYGAML